MFGKQLLDKGLKWMIGNGEEILVWVTPWIDDGVRMRCPLMKNIFIDLDLKVSALIEFQSDTWNVMMLNDLFYPQDVKLILKMKITPGSKDFKVWKYNSSGAYTSKSGYWLASKLENSEVKSLAEALPSINPLKILVWDLLISTKLRIFMWKIMCNALPVADGIAVRGMMVDNRCQFCGMDGETENHLFFICPHARFVWAVSDFLVPRVGFSSSIFQNIHLLLQGKKNFNIPTDLRKVFPWLLWRIWKNRNGLIFEGMEFEALTVVRKAFDDMNEWAQAQVVEAINSSSPSVGPYISQVECSPPPVLWRKCDIGVEWDKSKKVYGAAWLLRDDKGMVLMHSRCSFSNIPSLKEAHRSVWVWAIESMKSLGFSKIVFVGESKELVGAVIRPPAWPSFKWLSKAIMSSLQYIPEWKLERVDWKLIWGAYCIAQSVLVWDLFQSYVAIGFPSWLGDLFGEG